MKKTNRNQNMPEQNPQSSKHTNKDVTLNSKNSQGKPERFRDSNLNQSGNNTSQIFDDMTGTVENGLG